MSVKDVKLRSSLSSCRIIKQLFMFFLKEEPETSFLSRKFVDLVDPREPPGGQSLVLLMWHFLVQYLCSLSLSKCLWKGNQLNFTRRLSSRQEIEEVEWVERWRRVSSCRSAKSSKPQSDRSVKCWRGRLVNSFMFLLCFPGKVRSRVFSERNRNPIISKVFHILTITFQFHSCKPFSTAPVSGRTTAKLPKVHVHKNKYPRFRDCWWPLAWIYPFLYSINWYTVYVMIFMPVNNTAGSFSGKENKCILLKQYFWFMIND